MSNKENIKDIRSPKGQFRVFNFVVTDQQSNSIRICAFGEQAEKFHPLLTEGKVKNNYCVKIFSHITLADPEVIRFVPLTKHTILPDMIMNYA